MAVKTDVIYTKIKYVEAVDLTDTEKLNLINMFHGCYFDTAQAVRAFAVEFQRVVAHILSGCVPIELEFLEDFQEIISTAFDSDKTRSVYEKHTRN